MPCSSIQKLCSAGEREWVTGQPMIPASRVRPVILIDLSSCRQRPAAAQKAQQLEKRQPENGEMVAFHPLKQLNAHAFEPIGTDRAEQRVAFDRDVMVEKGLAERAHRQLWRACRVPDLPGVAYDAGGGRQDMR